MTIDEYFEEYRKTLASDYAGVFPRDIASCIGAGYYSGLSVEQLQLFMVKRSEISSVSVVLINQNTCPADIQKIAQAREAGKVNPADILRSAFKPEEVRSDLRSEVFGTNES